MAKKAVKKRCNGYLRKTFTCKGKRYCVYGKTDVELYEKVLAKKEEVENGKKDIENPTLNAYYETFTDRRRRQLRESTLRGQAYQYKNMARVSMADGSFFGDMRINEIKKAHVEEVRDILLKDGKTPEYLNIIFKHLNHVFATAIEDDLVSKNPCKALKDLKRENKPVSETIHRALTEDEVTRFFEKAEERQSFYINAFRLMILTGIREGELGALYPTDIDKVKGFIHIRRSVTRDEVGNYIIGAEAKTESGKRDIPLTSESAAAIGKQRNLNNMVYGLSVGGLLFRSAEGEILRGYTLNREIGRICKAADIEYFTCHAFRNTFATRFIEQRPQDYKILSEIMGHKDISITLNLYTHVMTDKKVNAMNDIHIINVNEKANVI